MKVKSKNRGSGPSLPNEMQPARASLGTAKTSTHNGNNGKNKNNNKNNNNIKKNNNTTANRFYCLFVVAAVSVCAFFDVVLPVYSNGSAGHRSGHRMAERLEEFRMGPTENKSTNTNSQADATVTVAAVREGTNTNNSTRAFSPSLFGGRPVPPPGRAARKRNRNATMVLAVAPLDKRHVTALWSELDCFARDGDLKKVVVSAPLWAEAMVLRILREAREKLPHFSGSSPKTELKAAFFENDRYDIGLWCDGLESLFGKPPTGNNNNNNNSNSNSNSNSNNNSGYYTDDVILLNDSLFALRPFTGILDALKGRNRDPQIPYSDTNHSGFDAAAPKHMVSLSYSLTDPAGMWLESVFRAFDPVGLKAFVKHSCHAPTHWAFCPDVADSREKKKCLVRHHEVGIARLFDHARTERTNNNNNSTGAREDPTNHGSVLGLYPSDVPRDMWKPERPYGTWASHMEYWKSVLINVHGFPAAKVSKRNMIKTMKHPLLQECTARFDRSIFEKEADVFDFAKGVRTIKRNSP